MDITINGKRVTLRDKIPARLGWDAIVLKLEALQGKDIRDMAFDDLAAIMAVAVESWELDGDPASTDSYAALDLATEFIPLSNALGPWLTARFSTPKN